MRQGAHIDAHAEQLEPSLLFSKARFRECLAALDGDRSPEGVLIQIRSMLAIGKHHTVVRADLLNVIAGLPVPQRARAQALLARAYHRCGMHMPADYAMRVAYQLAESISDTDSLSEVRYQHALLSWSRGLITETERLVNLLLLDLKWYAKGLELRAWVARERGNHAEQLSDLKLAFTSMNSDDVWMKAAILNSMSALAREIFDKSAFAFVEAQAERVEWSSDTSLQEFSTYRFLAWYAALAGLRLRAGEYFARAECSVPSIGHSALLESDRSYLAGWFEERVTAERCLEKARFLASQVDWQGAGEERSALLMLAQIMATRDVSEAERYIAQYCEIAQPISPLVAYGNSDSRRRAFEQYSAALVYRAKGMRDEAISAFKEALLIWRPLRYNWRAALAAVQLGEMTRPHYVEMAAILIEETVPNSCFRKTVEPYCKRARHPDVQRLSPQRREVLTCLMSGLANRAIAQRLQISESLVKRQVSKVFDAFGVSNVRELWPILRERGIT